MTNPKTLSIPSLTFARVRIVSFGLALIFSLALATSTSAAAQAVNFGSVNVCSSGKTTPAPCSANKTVTFSIPAGTTISSIPILTTGIADLDFKGEADDTSSTLCKTMTYSSATTCTVDVTFAPLAPGARNGAVELLNGDKLVATNYIYGIGVGPQVAFGPLIPEPLVLQAPQIIYSLAVDADANIFALSPDSSGSSSTVQEFLAADGYTTSKTLVSGITSEGQLTLDGAGNIFFSAVDNEDRTGVIELVAAQGYTPGFIAIPNGGGFPAVDGSGNLFVTAGQSSLGPPKVEELFASSGYKTSRFIGGQFNDVVALYLDAANNVFIEDFQEKPLPGGIIKEIVADGGYTTVKILHGNIYSNSTLFGVDAAGDVYYGGVTPSETVGIYESLAAGGYTTVYNLYYGSSTVCCGITSVQPQYGALDASGNLYLTSSEVYIPSPIFKLPRSQAEALDFGPIGVGGTSSPRSTKVQNIGNATLTGSLTLTDTTDFALVPGSGNPEDCLSSFSLASSALCDISIDFAPRSTGPLTAEAVLTDNALNSTDATQSVAFSGLGTTVVVSPTTLDFGSIPYPNTATKTLTLTNSGTATLTIAPSSDGPSAVIAASTCGAGIGAGKSCTIQVEFRPESLGAHTDTISIATNGATNPKVPVSGTATGVGTQTTSLNFGTLTGHGATSERVFQVINYGVPGTVSVATETGATSFHVVFNDCTTGIAVGYDCNIGVEFAPGLPGSKTAYLKLIPSTGPQQIVKMTGTLVP